MREVKHHYTLEVQRTPMYELLQFVRKCVSCGTSEKSHQIYVGDKLGRDTYRNLRDQLFKLGIADWVNQKRHLAGWNLIVPPHEAEVIIRTSMNQAQAQMQGEA